MLCDDCGKSYEVTDFPKLFQTGNENICKNCYPNFIKYFKGEKE